jgi:hypothetical protein
VSDVNFSDYHMRKVKMKQMELILIVYFNQYIQKIVI